MQSVIVNAAPMVIDRGTNDLSTRPLLREPEAIPQHLPKFYLYAEKGRETPQLVVGVERDNMYGTATFDPLSVYFNHATMFANAVNAEGNACMLERIVPDDAGPEANVLLSLDVLPLTVDLYERNSDGSIKLDAEGEPITDGTAAGYSVKWVASHLTTVSDLGTKFGAATITAGDQTTGTGENIIHSQRYPIFEFKLSQRGSYGNRCGLRIIPLTTAVVSALPTALMTRERTYPYQIECVRRPDLNSSAAIVNTVFAEKNVLVVTKPGAINPTTVKPVYIGTTLLANYQNITDLRYPVVVGDFGEMATYQDNVNTVLGLFHAKEATHLETWSDFTADAADIHLFNFISGTSTTGAPYHTFQFADGDNAIRLGPYTNVMAAGGSDGTMTSAAFNASVRTRLAKYLDPNDPVQELAVNVESIFIDSGFELETKYAAAAFISQRKDTFVLLGTHTIDEPPMTASEEHSLAVALRTRLQFYPESEYYGTPVMRALVEGRSGLVRNSLYTKRLPLTYEIAIKSAKFMGASDGRWKTGFHFDGFPGHLIEHMYDISIDWVPASVRNRNWDVGLNWVQHYDRKRFFFPALKTVYPDDTSVLNSYFTALAIGQLNKVAHAAWRTFSGVSHLTGAQLAERVDNFINLNTQGRFDDRFVIRPQTYISAADEAAGYRWTTPIAIYSPNMKTVMTTEVEAYRLEDLAAG